MSGRLIRSAVSNCLRLSRQTVISPSKSLLLVSAQIRLAPVATQLRCIQTSIRLDSKKKSKKPQKVDEDEDEEELDEDSAVVEDSSEDDNDGLPKDYKVVVASVSSTRLDNVIKAGMSWKRKTIDEGFAAGKFRVNSVLPPKKSVPINIGDKLDVILCPNKENPKFTDIARLQVLDINPNHLGRLSVKMKKWNVVTVEEYERDR